MPCSTMFKFLGERKNLDSTRWKSDSERNWRAGKSYCPLWNLFFSLRPKWESFLQYLHRFKEKEKLSILRKRFFFRKLWSSKVHFWSFFPICSFWILVSLVHRSISSCIYSRGLGDSNWLKNNQKRDFDDWSRRDKIYPLQSLCLNETDHSYWVDEA